MQIKHKLIMYIINNLWLLYNLTAPSEVSNDPGSLPSSTRRSDRAESEASNLDSFTEENKDYNSEDVDSGNHAR